MYGQRISWRRDAKYLGVIIDDKQSFENQCQKNRQNGITARAILFRLVDKNVGLEKDYTDQFHHFLILTFALAA